MYWNNWTGRNLYFQVPRSNSLTSLGYILRLFTIVQEMYESQFVVQDKKLDQHALLHPLLKELSSSVVNLTYSWEWIWFFL